MWICLNNAFFSIVADHKSDLLVVRARRHGDLERIFNTPGQATPDRDYAYRAFLDRDEVASVMMCHVLGVDYGNFKDSVKEPALKSAYGRVWGIMAGLQARAPWSGISRGPSRVLPPASLQRSLSGLGQR